MHRQRRISSKQTGDKEYQRGKDSEELFRKVNRGLMELSSWFRCNKLTLNLKKTEYVYFGGPRGRGVAHEGIRIGSEQIKRVGGVRFLGLWVDEGLKWTEQIEKVRSKVSRLLGVLGRARGALGGKLVHTLYNALVLPHLQYCLMIWGDFQEGRNKSLKESLLKCQKRFVGIISEKRGRYHADPIFSNLSILKIDDLYRIQLRVYAWQFLKGTLPGSQSAMLSKMSDVHRHNTRSAETGLSVSSHDQRSIGYRIPKEWQTLQEDLRKINSVKGLKKKSTEEFVAIYKSYQCKVVNCYICGREAQLSQRGKSIVLLRARRFWMYLRLIRRISWLPLFLMCRLRTFQHALPKNIPVFPMVTGPAFMRIFTQTLYCTY